MASKSIAVSFEILSRKFDHSFSIYQDIQHQGKFFIEPSSGVGKLNTADWPLLLKVFIRNTRFLNFFIIRFIRISID
jgi:hypothetical protein